MPLYVLLDRDGVINQPGPGGYVTSWSQFVFLPGALEALCLLAQSGYRTIVVSNQSCVAKGLLSSADLDEITQRFVREVAAKGGRIDGVYYCPHREDEGCECRKPKPRLLLNAQGDHGFDFARTYFVGNSWTDLQAAEAVGSPAILIGDDSLSVCRHPSIRPRAVVRHLLEAAEFIISRQKNL